MVLDVNVLIALASGDHPEHAPAIAWWDEARAGGDTFTVPDVVWVGFARIITSRRAVREPLSWSEAWRFAEALMAQPTYLRFVTDPRTLEEFARLAAGASARGNLISDAYIAACAAAYGATLVTFDRDFRKFDDLRVRELA